MLQGTSDCEPKGQRGRPEPTQDSYRFGLRDSLRQRWVRLFGMEALREDNVSVRYAAARAQLDSAIVARSVPAFPLRFASCALRTLDYVVMRAFLIH